MKVPFHIALAGITLFAAATSAWSRGSSESKRLSSMLSRDPVISSLNQQIAADPNNACLSNELGLALSRRAYFREAEQAYQASLKLAEDPLVYNNLGSLYLTIGRLSAAAASFNRAIRLDPNFALAYYNLGAANDAENNYEGAVRNYKRALELDSTLADPNVNPQVINNRYMAAVRTERYLETIGALGLPLRSTCPAAETKVASGSGPVAPTELSKK